jgi:protein-disulfide isomerase
VLKDRAADVKFVFKHSPLPFHPWAKPSAIAAVCATNQSADAFWILHDSYFNHQGEITPDNVIAKSKEFLASAKIDMAKWSTCAEKADSPEHKAAEKTVEDSIAFGQKHGVNGTPGFFVNGKFLNGAPDNVATVLTNMVDEAKGVAPAATTAPAPAAKKEDGKAK